MELAGAIETEIRELHEFFQNWFNASLPGTERELERVRRSWVSPFELVDPDGARLSVPELLHGLLSQYGAYPRLRIQICDLSFEDAESTVLVRYEERHIDGDQVDRRKCEAHFAVDASFPNGVRWVRLNEWREREGGPDVRRQNMRSLRNLMSSKIHGK